MYHAMRVSLLVAVAGAVVGGLSSSNAGDLTPTLVTEHFMIDASDPGIKLYIRNKRPEEMTEFKSEKTLLFVHGASQPAEGTFDLPLEGLSWMDYIARRGWDVYLVDVRGYGASTRPPEMDQPPANNPPIATTDVAVRDLKSAVDFIIRRRSLPKINLMGWSWGTVITAAYAADHPDEVERLVLYGPTWVRTLPPVPSGRPLGAYIETPMSRSRERMQAGAPEDRKNDLMPSSWFEAWSAAVLATDPLGSKQNPPVLRSPTGVFQDNRDYWDAGKPYYDPAKINAATLIVVAEWDYRVSEAQELFGKLPNRIEKRLVQIGGGTHLVMLEKNRLQLFEEVQFFLDRARLTN
jgi:pimeloyl-ACP methyl ester carboxylesterase